MLQIPFPFALLLHLFSYRVQRFGTLPAACSVSSGVKCLTVGQERLADWLSGADAARLQPLTSARRGSWIDAVNATSERRGSRRVGDLWGVVSALFGSDTHRH